MSAAGTPPTGCAVCSQDAYGAKKHLKEVAVHPDGPTFLRRCDACGTYWHETLRFIVPVTGERAAELYPSAFPSAPPVK
ncbi:MAG TPA: hypothetical protein VER32_11370 [Pyrinomonadaceae bacterium]|nr:hypothetical protein [Pyrinomonadaceae bacterium]